MKKKLIKVILIVLWTLFLCYEFGQYFSTKETNNINIETNKIALYRSTCGRFPQREDLNVSDTFWQVTNTTNGTFYLFNAYFDDREAVNDSIVRIIGMINQFQPTVETHCQLWFPGMTEPIPAKVYEYRLIWPEFWGRNIEGATPYLISCQNPFASQGLVPSLVSLVEGQCDNANNIFAVSNKRPKMGRKKSFLVCLRSMTFEEDISILMIEWAEILKILGVDNVMVYVEKAHPNVIKVLRYYQHLGFFILKFITCPHEFPYEADTNLLQNLQNQLISYNDALYEQCYTYEFIVPMDIDEFILPLRAEDRTWKDLIRRTNEPFKDDDVGIVDGYPVKNMYFLLKSSHENDTIPGIPKMLRFLSNIYRAANCTPEGGGVKTFMRMDRIFIVHNHFPLYCIDPEYCNLREVDLNDGQLSHYRVDCVRPECEESKAHPVKDTMLWKYREEILENVIKTLDSLRIELSDGTELDFQ